MTSTLTLVIYMAILTWAALLAASLIRARGWTPSGMGLAMGNRDNMPEATPFAARADRAARNTIEGFILFTAIALTAHAAGLVSPRVALGAEIFFWSRVLYLPIYWAGIAYLRTLVWTVGMVGLVMMISALL